MAGSEDCRFAFLAEWYDPLASLIRPFQLFYYVRDGSVEMFDLKLRRIFLKKTKVPDLRLADMYVGSSLSILSRQINLVDFGDDFTRRKLSAKTEKTLVVLPLRTPSSLGEALEDAAGKGLLVANLKTVTAAASADLCRALKLAPLSRDPALLLELVGSDAVAVARRLFPAAHVSLSAAMAAHELALALGRPWPGTACVSPRASCLVIRPHAMAAGLAGRILSALPPARLQLAAARLFRLDRASAEELLEIYRGVRHDFPRLVAEMSAGACLAVEVVGMDGQAAYGPLRELCGPPDPEVARCLRPHSLRARFGEDAVKNAVHCTDLPEDTRLELQYFFQLLEI